MDIMVVAITVGLILITMAGCALALFYYWYKQSLTKIAEERALIARRQQAISQREQEEQEKKRVQTIQARKERRAQRRAAHQLLLESQERNIATESPRPRVVSQLGDGSQ